MRRSIASLSLLVAFCGFAPAQDHPAIQAQPNTVYVSADGKFDASPDTAQIEFNISAQENSSRAAYDRAAQQAEQVRQILRSSGIDPKTAEISVFSINPIYDYKPGKPKLVAYRVNAS